MIAPSSRTSLRGKRRHGSVRNRVLICRVLRFPRRVDVEVGVRRVRRGVARVVRIARDTCVDRCAIESCFLGLQRGKRRELLAFLPRAGFAEQRDGGDDDCDEHDPDRAAADE